MHVITIPPCVAENLDALSALCDQYPLKIPLTAAAELGIDTCPIEGFNQEAAEKFLVETGMMDPKHFGLSYMLAFGYRAVEPKREKTRQKREDIVQWYQ